MYSNEKSHGGLFLDAVNRAFSAPGDVLIASGYVSDDIIAKFEHDFYRLASSGGSFKLLIGMAFYEGMSPRVHKRLLAVNAKLRELSPNSGIYVAYKRRYHGKIYSFKTSEPVLYIGSSNFSRSGLSENLEATALIEDEALKQKIQNYLLFLFDEANAVLLDKADITLYGTTQYLKRIALETLDDLGRYDPASISKERLPYFDFSLERIATSEKSNLNSYFGKGRWSRSTGKVLPRPWYEVELIAPAALNSNPLYPKGDFVAYTDDGYVMPMKTSGANFKNIRSRNKLEILGQWIKGKLQRADALIPLTPVTLETLERYGKGYIRFYKIREGEYVMEF